MQYSTASLLALLMSIAGSFGLGAVVGTLMFSMGAFTAAGSRRLPVGVMLVDWRKLIADIRELDLINDPELSLHGILTQLLPKGIVIYRAACARCLHRASVAEFPVVA